MKKKNYFGPETKESYPIKGHIFKKFQRTKNTQKCVIYFLYRLIVHNIYYTWKKLNLKEKNALFFDKIF